MKLPRFSQCFLCVSVSLWFFLASARAAEDEPKGGPPEFKHLKFRQIGPAAGGRVSRSVGIPGDPMTYYAASASGGVWKSSDGGLSWKPIFDDQPIASIGSIAVAPSDPNVIYVGSGEANPRGNVAPGNGIYKSTDAGKTWQHVWKQEGQIGKMLVHPTNPDIAYAAVLGHAFGPNPERGVYRTTDGGKKWDKLLFKDADTGACDLCFDPANPRILFAGLWQCRRKPWEFIGGGPGGGLYVSRDGGDTWKQLGPGVAPLAGGGKGADGEKKVTGGDEKGLPEGPWGRIGLAIAPSNNQRVYAYIEADKGGLYRSDDGGDKWELVNPGHYLRQRAWYFSTFAVDPSNADIVYFSTVRLLKSVDGGKTFKQIKKVHHPDHHDLWIDPKDPKRMIDSNDGGVDLTSNGGETWFAPHLPLGQFYHIACDNGRPYRVMGCMQDLDSASGPSNSLAGGGIALADWWNVGGGEAGFVVPDPFDPDIVYAGEYGGYITRYDRRTKQARNVSAYPTNSSGHGAEDLKYRFQWTAPIMICRYDKNTVYHAANVLFKTTDGGMKWEAISPDLTRNDKSKQKASGGPINGDNTGAEVYGTIFALAQAPYKKEYLWVGTDDGLVHVTPDGGKTWTNVTKNIAGIPEWGTVGCIEPSPFDDKTAYVVVDAHRLDNMKPYLFKTDDLGKTWKSLAAKLPQDFYLHAVREDPKKKGQLYAGTERGVYFSTDDGGTWQELKLNLSAVAVHDLAVKDNDLVLGTHGRSVWIFDDLTPVREYTPKIAAEPGYLFPVQPAVRYRTHSSYAGKGEGDNPPQGAVVHYFLKEKPKKPVTLEILDAKGASVAKLTSEENKDAIPEDDPDGPMDKEKKKPLPTNSGVNRAVWDLRYKGATIIKKAKVDAGDPEEGPLVNPGEYTAILTVEGKTLTTKVVVLPDPRTAINLGGGSRLSAELENGLKEQLDLALKIRDDITRLADTVNHIRSIRKQLNERSELLKDDPKAEALIKDSKLFIDKLDALEAKLHNPKAEVTYDILAQKGGAQLYSKMAALFDWIKDGDGAPTQGWRDEYAAQTKELQKYVDEFKALVTGDLAQLNEAAKKLEAPTVIVPAEKKP
jgi:photosystem II stability/assembly factor-like uncharacterized protein